MDQDASGADEYYTTAQQIFDYCGARNAATLRVDVLMDKFAPFVKTNKSEYSLLKSLLDPDDDNPEISVTKLANTLHTYSESQKHKLDLDESFNKSGLAPHDSDSGISTDGYQMLEELQSELREKSRLAHQLRSQLDYSDRQHEEALALLTAERDSVRIQINMLHDENASLNNIRCDYEEACEKLCSSEQELDKLKKELETTRRNTRVMSEQVATLENEKLTLQEQLAKSKEECHRINEMYAGRQSKLLEENESLRAEQADQAARLQDQEDFMQQIIKEKVMLEMELKELLNKSNQHQLRLDRSIDVSYTEDQMLTALDTLNTAGSFASELLSESTQAEIPCNECVQRNEATPHRLRRYLWEPLKCLFQLFAVVCFVCAISVLYGVSKQAGGRCEREATPWRWFDAQDIMDLLLRIEYVAEVPM